MLGRMKHVVPPLCLLLGLAMLIAAFAMLAVEAPADPLELHKARVTGDEAYRDVLEAGLAHRRVARTTLIVALFACSGLMVVIAFLAMTPKSPERNGPLVTDDSDGDVSSPPQA